MDAAVAIVERYLRSLVDHDWEGLRATLAPGVLRQGPYLDDYEGADSYIAMLEATLPSLVDYELDVARVWGDGDGHVCAELSETVTIDAARLRTDEAILFAIEADQIVGVQVFLRKSYDPTQRNFEV